MIIGLGEYVYNAVNDPIFYISRRKSNGDIMIQYYLTDDRKNKIVNTVRIPYDHSRIS